jgi:hypothetical protein
VLLLLVGTACGSRLPESDFEHGNSRTPAPSSDAPIRVGIITSATSPVGGDTFTGPRDGAKAYFDRLNARGGIDGRPVEVRLCDDGGSGVGNNECVHQLVDEDKVVALVATTALDYAGASRVSHARVPDIGGQPIGAAYDTWPHLYGIYGSLAPRAGTPGWGGRLYGGTEVYRYFKREQGARTAAVVSYNQAASAAYARLVEQGLKAEGYKVVSEQVDFALPDFRAVAADLKQQGADLVFDAIDTHGNAQLCEAMDQVGAKVIAKVTNVQNWTSTVPEDYKDSPRLRRHLPAGRTGFPGRDEGAEDAFPVAVGGLGGGDVVHGRSEVMCEDENGRHARVRRRLHEPERELHRGRSAGSRLLRAARRTAEDPQDVSVGGPLAGRQGMGPARGHEQHLFRGAATAVPPLMWAALDPGRP